MSQGRSTVSFGYSQSPGLKKIFNNSFEYFLEKIGKLLN
jgi:hypothetical protein